MKKIILIISILAIIGLVFFYSKHYLENKNKTTGDTAETINPEIPEIKETPKEDTESLLTRQSREVINLLKAKDWADLSKYISKKNGVRFSPYTFVNIETDKVFSADQIANIDKDNQEYIWGSYDGSGLPIELSFNDYYDKFIFDKDYTKSPQVSFNKPLKSGNTVNNIKDVYQDSATIEFHIPYEDPQYGGLDWGSLKLVWQEENGGWFITGIVNDHWTI